MGKQNAAQLCILMAFPVESTTTALRIHAPLATKQVGVSFTPQTQKTGSDSDSPSGHKPHKPLGLKTFSAPV